MGHSCGVLFSGNANNSANAGLAYANSNNTPSNTNANIGSHLCFKIGFDNMIKIIYHPALKKVPKINIIIMNNINHDTLTTVLNMVLGIIIGILIYNLFINKPVIKGPNSKDIVGKVFTIDNKKYYMEPFVCFKI